jgi:hypothetical protein
MTTLDRAQRQAGTPEQTGWLELARRQSQTLAEAEARRARSFRWETGADARRARGPLLALLLRPAWAAALVLLLAASVTLAAYVARRTAPAPRRQAPAAAKPAPLTAPAAAVAPGARATLEPAESIAASEETAPGPRRASKPEPKQVPEEKIILGPDDTDGAGEVIIVPAPRTKKLPPLFTPEDYKKHGRRSTRF